MHIEIQNCFSFWGTSSPRPGPHWGTSVPQTPCTGRPHILYQVYAPAPTRRQTKRDIHKTPIFQDKRRFQSKIANYFHPGALDAPLKGFPLEFGMRLGSQNYFGDISSAVTIQYKNVTGRRTDVHRPTAKTALTHGVARQKGHS